MTPNVTRKSITLPSGGTCVVRALSGLDFASMKNKPKAFPVASDLEAVQAGERELTGDEVDSSVAFMEAILTRCCSPITWDGQRKRIVSNKDLDLVADDEITIEELPQADANEIVATAAELSSLTKEAGESAGNFPEGSEVPSQPA